MSQVEEIAFRDLKCASCSQILQQPVQLSTCFHIICFRCQQNLNRNGTKITCPQCNKDSEMELIPHQEIMTCDLSPDHGVAQWDCFECGKSICSICRDTHTEGHRITLKAYPALLARNIWTEASLDTPSQEQDRTDDTNSTANQCPICDVDLCKHAEALQSLITGPQKYDNHCQQKDHVVNDIPRKLNFFCLECWSPICADCSIGKHKRIHNSHLTDDMSECGKKFIVTSLEVLREKLAMLIGESSRDASEAKMIEDRLQCHVNDTDKELNTRKIKIIEKTEQTFHVAIIDATNQGHRILTEYRDKFTTIEKFRVFLQRINEALHSVDAVIKQKEFAHYVGAFNLQSIATDLVQEMFEEYQNLAKPKEQRLVLPEMEATITPPHHLAQVGTERKHLKLAFYFPLDSDHSWINSFVLTANDKCLLSVRKSREETNFDSLVLYHYKGNGKVTFEEYDVVLGKYLLSRFSSGEIVASYSHYSNSVKNCGNKVLYFNGDFSMTGYVSFDEIATFNLPPYGIATTKENNIILCVRADDISPHKAYECKGLYQVMSMSLRGKILHSSLKLPDANLIRPDYVAVSDSGEICIADNENGSIVILNANLTIKERINYELPTSMADVQAFKFRPHGICYDTYGRIIVTDPDNNSVVRLVRTPGSQKYILEPLLSQNADCTFNGPKLVAMDNESRLWVVCTDGVFVFDYCLCVEDLSSLS